MSLPYSDPRAIIIKWCWYGLHIHNTSTTLSLNHTLKPSALEEEYLDAVRATIHRVKKTSAASASPTRLISRPSIRRARWPGRASKAANLSRLAVKMTPPGNHPTGVLSFIPPEVEPSDAGLGERRALSCLKLLRSCHQGPDTTLGSSD